MSFEKTTIKKLDNADASIAEKIYEVFQVSYAVEAEIIEVLDFPPLKRTVSDFQKCNTLFFGLWADDALAAAVELENLERLINICSLVVNPKYFRQGLASKLLQFVEEYDDSQTIIVETGLANIPAITLYKKFGFEAQKQWISSNGIRKIGLYKVK